MSDRPQLAQPRSQPASHSPLNPFAGASEVRAHPSGGGGLVSVEQQRAIAEVQARIIIARANPRDPIRAVDAILNDCTRPSLADTAVYQYARGGTDIRGPSIRLAEAIAQRWGNVASGLREIARHGDYSEVVAYAWDMETGFYDERQFQIRHWRDTRQGGYQLTDERDIYELIANFGQRRKRAVLLTIIPGDVTEAALQQCEQTMAQSADVTPEGVKKLLDTFGALGVSQQQIETLIQRHVDAIRPAQVVRLRKIYTSLADGVSTVADWFGEEAAQSESGQAADGNGPSAGEAPTPARRRGRPPGPSATSRSAPERESGEIPVQGQRPAEGQQQPAAEERQPAAEAPKQQQDQQRRPARVNFEV